MTIADTSAWIGSFKDSDHPLVELLEAGLVLAHELVLGELVCGGLTPKHGEYELIRSPPHAPVAAHDEVISLIFHRRLGHIGLGRTDAHLLASALVHGHSLTTYDRSLVAAAKKCGVPIEASG